MILVTGGAGFIGSHIVRALVDNQRRVRVLDNLSTGKRENLDGVDAELIVGDITDPAAVDGALAGVTAVFHEAADISVPHTIDDPAGSHHVNVDGTIMLLDGARRHGVKRFVLASSAAVYGDEPSLPKTETSPLCPQSPYALHKIIGEQYLKLYHDVYGLDTVSLRYFNVFGPRQDPASPYAAAIPIFVSCYAQGRRPTIFGDGGQTRDFVFIDDVVAANLAALELENPCGRVFNIAGGRSVDLLELLEHIGGVFGEALDPIFAEARPGDVRHSQAAINRAADALGFSPQVHLAAGLAKTVRWLTDKE